MKLLKTKQYDFLKSKLVEILRLLFRRVWHAPSVIWELIKFIRFVKVGTWNIFYIKGTFPFRELKILLKKGWLRRVSFIHFCSSLKLILTLLVSVTWLPHRQFELYWGDSFTQAMLITTFTVSVFDPKVNRNLVRWTGP